MVRAFASPHEIGSICHFPCDQCGDDPGRPGRSLFTIGQVRIDIREAPPMFIKREATRREYLAWQKSEGHHGPWAPEGAYYYEVSTD